LSSLTHLDLRANRLAVLPDSIGDLPKLEKLDLRWNKLSSLPEWMQRLEEGGCSVYH
jgi:Leucine-rich repeat (LRR) protein